MRRQADRDVHRNKAGLFGGGENIGKMFHDANPNVLVVQVDERHDPPGLAAVHPGDPSRHHGAFIIPIIGENRSQGAVTRPTPSTTWAAENFFSLTYVPFLFSNPSQTDSGMQGRNPLPDCCEGYQ